MPFTVMFVCTGNTCRSPMAQMLLQDKLARRGLGDKAGVMSAGVAALPGGAISEGAKDALRAFGIDAKEHKARSVDQKLLDGADIVITMSKGHLANLLLIYPAARGKMFTLAEFCGRGRDVADPFGGSFERYADCAREIDVILQAGLEKFICLMEEKG